MHDARSVTVFIPPSLNPSATAASIHAQKHSEQQREKGRERGVRHGETQRDRYAYSKDTLTDRWAQRHNHVDVECSGQMQFDTSHMAVFITSHLHTFVCSVWLAHLSPIHILVLRMHTSETPKSNRVTSNSACRGNPPRGYNKTCLNRAPETSWRAN